MTFGKPDLGVAGVCARWKVLHNTLRQVFAPVIVSAYVTPIGAPNAALYVYAVSDQQEAIKGSIHLALTLWSTGEVVYSTDLPASVPALSSVPTAQHHTQRVHRPGSRRM